MKKFRRIFNYIGLYKGKVALYIFLTIVGSALSVVSIAMLGPLMSIIFNVGGDTAQSLLQKVPGGHLLAQELTEYVNSGERMNAVLLCCVFIITSIFLKNLFLYSSSRVSVPVRSSIVIHLKNDMYSKILKLPVGYFSEQKKGDIMSRMTNDIGQVESSIVNTLEGMIKDPILVISSCSARSISPLSANPIDVSIKSEFIDSWAIQPLCAK